MIKLYIDKLKEIINNNILYISIIVSIILIIYITYRFSPNKRITNKIEYINNTLIFDKPRVQLDFCGIDNSSQDNFKSKIQIVNNTISILDDDDTINLYELGLSSEYFIQLENTKNNETRKNDFLRIKEIKDRKTMIILYEDNNSKLTDETTVDGDTPVTIKYFRPSSNLNIYAIYISSMLV